MIGFTSLDLIGFGAMLLIAFGIGYWLGRPVTDDSDAGDWDALARSIADDEETWRGWRG